MREICMLRSTWRAMETSYGSVRAALPEETGATDRPDLRVWRHSSTLPISEEVAIYRVDLY